MKIPPNLQKGDSIAVVATARSVQLDDIQDAIQLAESWGLKVVIGNSITQVQHQFAGSDAERAADLQAQIKNPQIKAIWCAKGGYGSVRILDLVDFSPLRHQPKWIIGYSDVTAIHAHLQRLGMVSLHAQMAVGIETKSKHTAISLKKTLLGKEMLYSFQHHAFNQPGEVAAEVVGGNLSVLYSLCGSVSFPDFKNKIWLIEDVDEYLYHIDRMMQNLKRNGIFDELAGIIVGGLTAMNDNAIAFGLTAEEIINEYTKNLNIPVAFAAPFGHQKENFALPLGKSIQLKVTQNSSEIRF